MKNKGPSVILCVAITILSPIFNLSSMDNDNSQVKKKANWPKKGFLAMLGVIGVIGLLIMPGSISPAGNVMATWTNYGSYISTMSSIILYDDEDNFLASWTENTHNNHVYLGAGTVIGNITISGILRTTELANPADPIGMLDLDVWFVGSDGEVHTYYNYNVEHTVWLDSDDFYFICYFTEDAVYPSPDMEEDCVIEYDYTHVIGAKMRLLVP